MYQTKKQRQCLLYIQRHGVIVYRSRHDVYQAVQREGREGVGDAVIYCKNRILSVIYIDLQGDRGFTEHRSANDCLQAWNRHDVHVMCRALRYRIVRLTSDVLPALSHLVLHP